MRKVEILPKKDFWGFEIESNIFLQKRIIYGKRLLEMLSVAENNSIISAIDKLDNILVSVTVDKPM